MIHKLPSENAFKEPSRFTDPFRYVPHPAVRAAAKSVIERIESEPELASGFSEGKMLGVLVCREGYIAAFSGNIGGRSIIEGFVPPIFDLQNPDGEFKRREAEISELNHQIEKILDSDRLLCLERELADAMRGSEVELTSMKEAMAVSKARREQTRKDCTDPVTLQNLIKESQHEKAEYRRLKKVLNEFVARVRSRVEQFHSEVESLKKQRATMSESLQDWIFRQYIVHNASGESASIAEIFAQKGLVPPGGTGECAAPKLLEYAYRNGLEPLAMGEFWYGRSPETAVRTHGHFYPSCTSKCGPLLGYMLRGISFPSSDRPVASQNELAAPIIIYEDETIIVVEKPSGMPSVPGLDGRKSLHEWLEEHLSGHLHAVHRLDMDTSGVMIFAKTHEAAVNLRGQFEAHTIRKTYMARVRSVTNRYYKDTGKHTICLPLSPDYDERPRQKVDFKQGKAARTDYEIVRNLPDGTSDLLLHPTTGRTHQLRVHCAHTLGLGRPILNDMLYGAHSVYDNTDEQSGPESIVHTGHPSRLCLHALSLTFTHPLTSEPLTFTSQQLCY